MFCIWLKFSWVQTLPESALLTKYGSKFSRSSESTKFVECYLPLISASYTSRSWLVPRSTYHAGYTVVLMLLFCYNSSSVAELLKCICALPRLPVACLRLGLHFCETYLRYISSFYHSVQNFTTLITRFKMSYIIFAYKVFVYVAITIVADIVCEPEYFECEAQIMFASFKLSNR